MTTVIEEPFVGEVEALPHTPVYRMHRYFARRPHNVINALIKHYTRPGSIILDPFCGGGTTVIEGLRLRRKVIGVDLNPMATLITRCEAMNLASEDVKASLDRIAEDTREEINALYQTSCPECGAEAIIDWTKWSVVYICPHCSCPAAVAEAEKQGPGQYACPHCAKAFHVTNLPRQSDKILEQRVSCSKCGFSGMKQATEEDIRQCAELERRFDSIAEQERMWYPQDVMPLDYDLRKPNNLTCERFSDFFSKRNLLALARLLQKINNIEDREVRYFLLHVFTSIVGWTNRMVTDERHGWALHAYWLPDIYCENNVWNILRRRSKWAIRGKRYSEKEIGDYFVEAQSASEILQENATCWLLTQSSTSLPLPDGSVDAVITDPPYGGNVQYGELCSFWAVWLPETLETGDIAFSPQEAVMKRYKQGEIERFERLLGQTFSECHRVLKDGGWLVITFNNRDTKIWFSMLRAARQAGFCLARDGISYQSPIVDYARTLHQMKDGAIKGDFILSFRKRSDLVESDGLPYPENVEAYVVDLVASVLETGPATFSQVYQEIIPSLVTQNVLGTQAEELDLEALLSEHFAFEEMPVETETDWPLKRTVVRKWTLPADSDSGELPDA